MIFFVLPVDLKGMLLFKQIILHLQLLLLPLCQHFQSERPCLLKLELLDKLYFIDVKGLEYAFHTQQFLVEATNIHERLLGMLITLQ